MMRILLKSKLHRAKVTGVDLNYMGSITLDEDLIAKAGFVPYEKVLIANINNGERFETYIISGKKGTREVILNGAAAKKVTIGDRIIVMTFGIYSEEEMSAHTPIVLSMDENNRVLE